ncbi:alkaline phosphatase [Novosphingobium resinovorum]|uniref:alkaline phosphatase n=1 Tax=Novosphingobium TaxID=165696 RepID=UPI001EEEB42C|nr:MULTISPECIES: alkaline phosphatase [Novosphingobium]WJM24693.1 alkaline phosphatase [Novosphingobium resinovorum]
MTYRKCYGPVATTKQCPANALEKGGSGSIAEHLLEARADVVLGGCAATFAGTAAAGKFKGKTLCQQAQSRGYLVVRNATELDAVTAADQSKPVLGLFFGRCRHGVARWKAPLRCSSASLQRRAEPAGCARANDAAGREASGFAHRTQPAAGAG